MKICTCGAGNPEAARFCAECGRTLEAGPPKCPACGAVNAAGARFCVDCGAPMAAGTRPLALAPVGMTFDARMLIGPITSAEGAITLARIGAAGAAILFLNTLIGGAPVLQSGNALLILFFLGRLGVYGGSAFALFRGMSIGGLASLVLHGLSMLQSLMAYNTFARANPGAALSPSAGRLLLIILFWILVPAALVCGIRGAMAWNRFRRGESGAVPTP